MRNSLLIATNNAHKILEFKRLLNGINHEILTPASIGVNLDVEESGNTFEQNARLKAHAFAKATGIDSLADDSGIEVDALDGRPGVYSARYGGTNLSDEDRVQLLLRELVDVPTEKLMSELFHQFRQEGRTILISTHDLNHVRDFCDLVVLINKTVLAYGETSDVFTKENLTMTFGGMPPNPLSGPTPSEEFR